MLKHSILSFALALGLGATAQTTTPISLIPQPQKMTIGSGTLTVDSLAIASFTDFPSENALKRIESNNIQTVKNTAIPKEGYKLSITANGIHIEYSDNAGLLYAKQTLRQLARTSNCQLPCIEINDYPTFSYRGFMIDEARHFFGKAQVKKMLDLMASYKLNTLHWHLTDDQGWRIHIPEYPLLTTKGAERKGSMISRGTEEWFYDDTPYGKGMFYTLDDLAEIVAYAAERNIQVIPEVDLPGHMVAALTAYPEFSCDPTKNYEVRLAAGVDENVLNVGDDKVIDFLKTVLGHVAKVFPSPYIHIGGDECPTKVWETNALALKRVKDEGLKSVHDLQPWLAQLLGKYLKENYNKDIIVWDELLAHWPDSSEIKPVAMAWRGVEYAKKAADKGFSTIVVPVYPMYFDLMQVDDNEAIVEETYHGGYGVNRMREVYKLNPVAAVKGQEHFVFGTQANLWAETLRNSEQLEYSALPRLLALSEVAWLPAEKKNWDSFIERLQAHDELFEADGYTYARHAFRQPVPTALDSLRRFAKEARPGEVGYPAKSAYKAVEKILKRKKATPEAYALALKTFEKAPITLPKDGQKVRLYSASTYYKKKYAGASLYAGKEGARVHYTPQHNAEEVWTFIARGTGFVLRNTQGKELLLTPEGKTAFADYGTVLFVKPATKPFRTIHYAHGAVTLTDATGRALFIAPSANIIASDDTALANPATWRMVTEPQQ